MNKITNTKVGDDIHFYVNGIENRGMVVKMNNSYVTVFKEDGQFEDIQLNETFFVKDIVLNKTWDFMNHDERLVALSKSHAPSPRYLTKSWDEIPKVLQEIIIKNNAIESSSKEGKDDDMNTTVRIFDQNKASSGDTNTLTESGGEGSSSNSMVTDPKKRSGGFKLNTPLGTEGMAGEKGDKGFGQTMMTRQHGIKPRDPSTEEQKGEQRGTSQTDSQAAENKKEIASSSVRLFSGYDKEGNKEYKNQAWHSWLADRKDLLNKDSPSDLEKTLEKLNQIKSNVENSTHGTVAGVPNAGVNTNTKIDAPKDYEGATHSGIRPEQFKHENKKPEIKKEKLDLGDTKPSDTHGGSNKYDTKQQGKNIKGRIVDQKKDTI